MKRFSVGPMHLYYADIEAAQKAWPDEEICEIDDNEHLPLIDKILALADGMVSVIDHRDSERLYFWLDTYAGKCEVQLTRDKADGHFYDYAMWRLHKIGRKVEPVLWSTGGISKFVGDFNFFPCKYELVSCGSKLKKPQELKGIMPVGSVSEGGKSAAYIFVRGNDIWIKHTDYMSPIYERPEDVGTPLNYRMQKYGLKEKTQKFIYDDSWGSIVIRQCAWIRIRNAAALMRHLNRVQFAEKMFDLMQNFHKFKLDLEWMRFYEKVGAILA